MAAPDVSKSPWNAGFTRFFIAQCFAWLGSSMTPVALAFGILDKTDNVGALGLVLAANTVPMVAFVMLGGVFADRLPRKVVLLVSQGAAAATQALTAAWFFSDSRSVALVSMLAAANGLSIAFSGPALRGILAELVHSTALEKANAARSFSRNSFRLLGPTVAGILVASSGAGWALAVDSACLTVAAILFAFLPMEGAMKTQASILADLREGVSAYFSHDWLWAVTISFFAANCIYAAVWLVMGPVVAERDFGAASWGAILGTLAAGQMAAGLIVYAWRPRRPLVTVQLGSLAFVVAFLMLGFGFNPVLIGIAAFFAGVGMAASTIIWESHLQREISPSMLSRVASIDMLGSFSSVPLGQLIAPFMILSLGIETSIYVASVVYVLAIVSPLMLKQVRKSR